MFDPNPLAMKYHLQDLERQVAASRRSMEAPHVPAASPTPALRSDSLVERYGRILARAFAGLA